MDGSADLSAILNRKPRRMTCRPRRSVTKEDVTRGDKAVFVTPAFVTKNFCPFFCGSLCARLKR